MYIYIYTHVCVCVRIIRSNQVVDDIWRFLQQLRCFAISWISTGPPKQVGISLAQPCFFDAEKMDMCRRDDWPPSWKHGWEIMGHGVQVELASEFNKDVGSSFSPPMKSTEG